MQKSSYIRKIKEEGGGKDSELSIIILSSKPGSRMKSFGPQCLIKDRNGNSILEHQTNLLQQEFPKSEIVLVSGFEVDKVSKNTPSGVRIVENQLFEQSNDTEDLRLAINNILYDNILILFGDIYFSSKVIDGITKKSTLVVNDSLTEEDIGTTIVDNNVTILSLSISSPKWGKIAYFSGLEARLLKQFVANRGNSNLFMWECLNSILDKGGQFGAKSIRKNDILVHVDNSKELGKIL